MVYSSEMVFIKCLFSLAWKRVIRRMEVETRGF